MHWIAYMLPRWPITTPSSTSWWISSHPWGICRLHEIHFHSYLAKVAFRFTSMFCPAWMNEDGGFIKIRGFVGTAFPSSAAWSLIKDREQGNILYEVRASSSPTYEITSWFKCMTLPLTHNFDQHKLFFDKMLKSARSCSSLAGSSSFIPPLYH